MQMPKKILFITLSNIGDVILTLPVLDLLRQVFTESSITVMTGSRPREIFASDPRISKLIIFDKRAALKEKIRLFFELNKEKFDIVVDLRNSFFGAFLSARHRTSFFSFTRHGVKHMKDRHLQRVVSCQLSVVSKNNLYKADSLYISEKDQEYIDDILRKNNIKEQDKVIVLAPGARSHIKRWPKENFFELAAELIKQMGAKIILLGDKDDAPINKYIALNLQTPILDLSAQTTLAQAACLLKKSRLLVTNDSALLHLASYLNIPLVAIFGPTDDTKYGPWSDCSRVAKKEIFCRPCQKAQCRFGTLDCMNLIKVEDVYSAVKNMLFKSLPRTPNPEPRPLYNFKRILIARTDRIGDVLLSTPVIKALRDAYPCAYIAMMVGPNAKEVVEANPYLDEVIIYDKEYKHKSWGSSIKFAMNLRKNKFDLALILHPNNRAHLVAFLAAIPKRVGYDRKMGFLLTDRIKHTKQLGQKHELEYNLDLVRYLGIEPEDKSLFMPIGAKSEKFVKELLIQEGIKPGDKLLAIHPAASCPSKIWPPERFAQVADKMSQKFGFKVLLIAGPKDMARAEALVKEMHHPVVNLAGRVSLSQLASVLKRCELFISNDSGPVHLASAVGTPVISIFGRNQKGLSPLRWGPVGKKDKFLHKEVGCVECLAHNCQKGFACLKAISVEDVLSAARDILLK